MALCFVDTNVLLYCVDDADPAKQRRAQQWVAACWRGRCGRVSTHVLGEFYVNASRKFKTAISRGDARAEVRRYQAWQPWLIDQPTIESAWAVEARYKFSYWDSLVVAAAQATGCRYLLSEDMQHEQRIDKLQIINPFLVDPELLGATP